MEQTAQTREEQGSEPRRLRVSDILSREVVTAASDETVFSAVARMSEHGVSCVVVTDGRRVA